MDVLTDVMSSFTYRDVVVLCICAVVHVAYKHRQRPLLPLPPGLPRWPIIGNAFSIPLTYAHIFYNNLGRKLGTKMIYLEVLGRPLLIINDVGIAQDLLDKRSALYSSRPELPMAADVIGANELFVTQAYGDEWRNHRRIFQQHFSSKHQERILDKGREFLRKGLLPNLLDVPCDYHEHLRNFIGGLSVSLTYGLPVQRRRDHLVLDAEHMFNQIALAAAPGRYLVNIIPSLRYIPEWMPGAEFQRVGREVRENFHQVMEESYQATLKEVKNGTARESFVSTSLEMHKSRPDFEMHARHIKETAAQVFGAFAETTVAAITSFILAMLKYPEVQERAQAEIDAAIGDGLPDFKDASHLPYLSAIIKEVLRWNPILPLGVPHMTITDDVYNGYFIPKGCAVMANAYAMLHDGDIFPNPTEFDPERFLKDGSINRDLLDPEIVATFGFGRRICPGSHVALPMIYLTAASILSLFNISPALDDKGRPIEVTPKFIAAAITSEPLPFECKIEPRINRDVEGLLKDYIGDDAIC